MLIFLSKRGLRLLSWWLGVAVCTLGVWQTSAWTKTAGTTPRGYLCIVIDDFGYDGEGTEEMLALSVPITAAVMPFSSHSREDVQKIVEAGKEVMIHMPMEALNGKREWVGDKGVFVNMTAQEIRDRIQEALGIVPEAVGINNHMGSAVMSDEAALTAVMEVAAENELIFVDSLTTSKSLAKSVSEAAGVRLLSRSVFLDSTDDEAVVKRQLERAAQMAVSSGSALAIGHVGPEGGKITADAIAQMAPLLKEQGVEFVTVSQLADILDNQAKNLSQTGGL